MIKWFDQLIDLIDRLIETYLASTNILVFTNEIIIQAWRWERILNNQGSNFHAFDFNNSAMGPNLREWFEQFIVDDDAVAPCAAFISQKRVLTVLQTTVVSTVNQIIRLTIDWFDWSNETDNRNKIWLNQSNQLKRWINQILLLIDWWFINRIIIDQSDLIVWIHRIILNDQPIRSYYWLMIVWLIRFIRNDQSIESTKPWQKSGRYFFEFAFFGHVFHFIIIFSHHSAVRTKNKMPIFLKFFSENLKITS